MTRRKTATPSDFVPVKVRSATHRRLASLLERISRVGWTAIGIDRGDAPTRGSVVDAALDLLERKVSSVDGDNHPIAESANKRR